MSAAEDTPEHQFRSQPATLGNILYGNSTKVHTTEDEWVGLVRSIAEGDQRALRSLYEQTHRLVFTLTFRITKDRETAEELTLDVFHDVWRKASNYEPSGGSCMERDRLHLSADHFH